MEAEKIQRYKDMKFDLEKQNLSDSQKEVFFMNERIRSIEKTNKAIIEMLNGSEVLYKRVAKDLKNLYESVYADEDTLAKKAKRAEAADPKASSFLTSKIDTRIKLYEKLNRAKKKINLAALFKKVSNKSETLVDINTMNQLPDGSPVKGDHQGVTIVEKKEKGPVILSDLKLLVKKAKATTSKDELENSDIIETDVGPYGGNVPSMETCIKLKTTEKIESRLIESRMVIEDRCRSQIGVGGGGKKQVKARIKSHSVDNQNTFLTYFVQDLNFIPLELLEELLDNSSSNEDDDDENDSELLTPGLKRKGEKRRASVTGETKAKRSDDPEKKKRKKTRVIDTTKTGKIIPKNYDKRLWELSGKILERMEAKAKLESSVSVLERTNEKLQDAEEIDKAILAAQGEIKRLLQLKQERAQLKADRNQKIVVEYPETNSKVSALQSIDNSIEINISMDHRDVTFEAVKNSFDYLNSMRIPIIKEEEYEITQMNSGVATPNTLNRSAIIAQQTLANLRESRWMLFGRKRNHGI